MNYIYTTIVCVLLFVLSFQAYGGYYGAFEVRNKIADELNKALEEEFLKPNQWGYKVEYFSPNSLHGLTYSIDPTVNVYRFDYQDVDSATKVFVSTFRDFINRVNNMREFRPFFAHFPMTAHNMEYAVVFRNQRADLLPHPYIAAVTLKFCGENREKIWIRQLDKKGVAQTILELKPEEIHGLIDLLDIKVSKKQCIEKPKIPLFNRLSTHDNTPSTKAELEFAKKFCAQHKLHILAFGCVAEDHEYMPRAFSFAMRGSQTLILDEARLLAATCAQQYLAFLQSDKRCIQFIEKRSKDPYWNDSATTPLPRHQAFRISFWDENVDRVPPGYIAEIRAEGESFRYYTSDEYQRLQLVHEESFDEVMKVLEKG